MIAMKRGIDGQLPAPADSLHIGGRGRVLTSARPALEVISGQRSTHRDRGHHDSLPYSFGQ
jgi:hypothetical protein